MILGHQKGRDVKENLLRNFGCAHPEGYRKAMRLMRLAVKFHTPVVCLIDTPGAYPGIQAEERGQALAIAENLRDMAAIKTPIAAVIIGEGGSGGAWALGWRTVFLFCSMRIIPSSLPRAALRSSGAILKGAAGLRCPEVAWRAFGEIRHRG